jgi:hypothetical protein
MVRQSENGADRNDRAERTEIQRRRPSQRRRQSRPPKGGRYDCYFKNEGNGWDWRGARIARLGVRRLLGWWRGVTLE